MRAFRLIAAALILAAALMPQAQDAMTLTAPPPAPVGTVTAQAAASGNATYYYWIIARYPQGNATPSAPAIVTGAPSTLSAGDNIKVFWRRAPGATSYDVLRTTTPAVPSGSCTCVIVANTTATTITDTGLSASAYTFTSASGATRTILLDPNAITPQLRGLEGFPQWEKHILQKVANGSFGCANAKGCWMFDGVLTDSASPSTLQNIFPLTYPARSWILEVMVRNTTTWTGPTTVAIYLGTLTDGSFYIGGSGLNPKNPPSNTNFVRNSSNRGTNTLGSVTIRLVIITTGANVDDIADGATLELYIMRSTLP